MAQVDPLRTRIVYKGSPLEAIIASMDKKLIGPQIQRGLAGIKNRVIADTRRYIDNHRQRLSAKKFGAGSKDPRRLSQRNNLINTIDALSRIGQYKWGAYFLSIGEIRMLDVYVPYWYKVNYGGKIEMPVDPRTGLPGGVPGYFDRFKSPVSGANGGLFHYTGRQFGGKKFKGKSSFMIPMKPIPPMRYLAFMKKRFGEEIVALADGMKQAIRNRTTKKK